MRGVSKCFVFLICVASLDAGKFRCDYSYSNGGWLKYHEMPATWSDARMRCRFEGAMLLSPTTAPLKSAMLNLIRYMDVFTGIHAISPGNYHTIDGIPLDAIPHRWAENEPNNKDNTERCITMNAEGNFSDVCCDIPHPYICYKADSLKSATMCGTTDEEYHFESRTNKCYKFHTTPRTYERAHFVCSVEGGHLAIINSAEESQVIIALFGKYPDSKILGPVRKDVALIGFNNYGESADWTTLHGQTLVEAGFQQFFNGQPDNVTAGEYCGGVHRNGLLFDLWCESHYTFICEKDISNPGVCDSNDYNEDVDCKQSRFKLLQIKT